MNPELVSIRRERWLQSKAKERQDDCHETCSSASELNKKDNGSSSAPRNRLSHSWNANAPEENISKTSTNYVDLTLSDDDDDEEEEEVQHVLSFTHQYNAKESTQRTKAVTKVSRGTSSSSSASAPSSESTVLKSFSICSYNIWFSDVHIEERMARMSEVIGELHPRPTFLGFQEVTDENWQFLSPLLQSMGYVFVRQEGVAYGCAIGILTNSTFLGASAAAVVESSPAVHAQVIGSGFQPYSQSQMGRGLLWVHASIEAVGEVLFTTTHLESYIPGNNGSKEREMQLQEASQFCMEKMKQSYKGSIKVAFITGDLNWDDERKRSSGTDRKLLPVIQQKQIDDVTPWMDSWLECNPGKDGFTYDSRENPMLKGNLRRRFDRCLMRFRSDLELSIHETNLIGKDAIPGLTWRKEIPKWNYGRPTGDVSYDLRPVTPSDHFGLFVSLGHNTKETKVQKISRKKRRLT